MKKKVLVLVKCYVPGFKSGGPIQSVKNLVENLSGKFDFYLVTSDRDSGDTKPYQGVETEKWTQVGNANVYYTNRDNLNITKLKKILQSVQYEVLYLNSFFSHKFSILPLVLFKMNKLPNKSAVVAPRGEFSEGALSLKSLKKRIYINTAKLFGLYDNVKWHATNEFEKAAIQTIFKQKTDITVAGNLTPNYRNLIYDKEIEKKPNELKLVSISRIVPMKNLLQSLKVLSKIEGKIKFSIYGPLEDKAYWAECENIISKLPDNIEVTYKGLVEHSEVMKVHKENHVFFLLTLGENFGHSISEALIGGCPVIISDRTPWKDLGNHNVGWEIPLEDEERIIEKINYFLSLDNEQYLAMSKSAFEYGKEKSNKAEDLNTYVELFS